MPTSQALILIPEQQHPLVLATPLYPDQNPAIIYLASLSAGSRRTMQNALNTIAEIIGTDLVQMNRPDKRSNSGRTIAVNVSYQFVNWSALRYQHTAVIRARLAEKYSPATANKMLSALRQVVKEAWRLGQMTAEEYQRATDVKNVTGQTLPAGRDIRIGEISALVRECVEDQTPSGARDLALIAVMATTGIRRASVVKLDVSDYNVETGTLVIRQAKGNKEYLAYVVSGAKKALDDWLAIRGDSAGPIFTPITQKGQVQLRRMSDQAIYNALVKRGEQAELQHFSPHDFRRTLAEDLLDAGADIVTVQKILNHANVQTTARYDRRPEETKRKAAELVHFPYGYRRR